jgi:hypothetical protein
MGRASLQPAQALPLPPQHRLFLWGRDFRPLSLLCDNIVAEPVFMKRGPLHISQNVTDNLLPGALHTRRIAIRSLCATVA